MSRDDHDYYNDGRHDAEWGDGRHTPHDSLGERILWDDRDVRDRADYRRGYSDGGGSGK
jgi:hypothetical protein